MNAHSEPNLQRPQSIPPRKRQGRQQGATADWPIPIAHDDAEDEETNTGPNASGKRSILVLPGVGPKLEIALAELDAATTVYFLRSRFMLYGPQMRALAADAWSAFAEHTERVLTEKFRYPTLRAAQIAAEWSTQVGGTSLDA